MKKIFLMTFLAIISFTSTRVSDNEILNGVFTSSSLKEFTKDSYDYNNDLAVVSDRLINEEDALTDAKRGLEYSINIYLNDYLVKIHNEIKLNGQSFDGDMMRKMAKDISKEIINEKEYIIAKVGKTENKYVVLLKISKESVQKKAKQSYRERLKKVIERLNDIYHDLEM